MISRLLYAIPFVVWLVVTVIGVQLDYFNVSTSLFIYCAYSVVIALSLIYYRNRNHPIHMSKMRIGLYFAMNLVLGIPFFQVLFLSHAPLKFIYPDGDLTLMAWQQYVFITYVAIWFIANALIIRPGRLKQVLLFVVSPLWVVLVPILMVNIIL